MQMTLYTIYKTTNILTGKIYIGKHQTMDLDDGYLGSGKHLCYSIDKHGKENFSKEILFVFDNEAEMNAKEAELVTATFVLLESNYNLCVGGHGGFGYINQNNLGGNYPGKQVMDLEKLKLAHKVRVELNKDVDYKLQKNNIISDALKTYYKEAPGNFTGKIHSQETIQQMSESRKGLGAGAKNSQFGSRWIHSPSKKVSCKIKKDEPLPTGYVEGRKIKFK